jgi:Family of unknown function (DUF6159)
MGGRFQNSIELAKASLKVLRGDRKLVMLPVLSSIATLIVAVSFIVPIAIVSNNAGGIGPAAWILGAVGYFLAAYVVVFFNAALVYAADAHMHGTTVTVGQALKFASSRSHVLLPWALLSASVSIVLRALEQRGGIFGRIIGALAGIAWSLVTFLVLPVLVVEGLGPVAAVKRSGELFKRAWGEQVISNAGIGLIALLAIVVGAIPAALLFLVGGPIVFVGIALFVAWVIAVSLVSSALTGILSMALYRFATDGQVPGFDTNELRGAFRPRNRRGMFGQ